MSPHESDNVRSVSALAVMDNDTEEASRTGAVSRGVVMSLNLCKCTYVPNQAENTKGTSEITKNHHIFELSPSNYHYQESTTSPTVENE